MASYTSPTLFNTMTTQEEFVKVSQTRFTPPLIYSSTTDNSTQASSSLLNNYYPDIYIPCVLSNVTEENIKKTFLDSSICVIDTVDFVKEEHKKYRCAIIKVLLWFDNDYANHIRNFLINNQRKQYDFVYDYNKNLKWFLYKSTAVKQEEDNNEETD